MNSKESNPYNTTESGGNNENEWSAFVRYAGDDGRQEPRLRPVTDEIQDGATTASPLYLLKRKERRRLSSIENPYAVSDATSIATDLQDDCEEDRRVLYPVYVESDGLETTSPEAVIQWIQNFIRQCLPVSPHDCQWFYSGNRSIHAHIPLFVRGPGLDWLRESAKDFNEEAGVELDPCIYSRKRQFRLPGVMHESGDLPKTEIEPEWSGAEIIPEAADTDASPPETMADVLESTFGATVLDNPKKWLWDPTSNDDDEEDEGSRYRNDKEIRRHTSRPFSPYANAGDGERSLAVLRVMGEVTVRNGRQYVPADVIEAVGCDSEYRISDLDSADGLQVPVILSDRDRQKWSYQRGDYLVIIGGRSRSSRIHKVSKVEAFFTAGLLDDYGRAWALEYLEEEGYETGSSQRNDTRKTTDGEGTEAAKLQRRAEEDGFDDVGHEELLHIANRLLQMRGFDGAMEWFRDHHPDFDEENTERQLRSIAEKYSDLPR